MDWFLVGARVVQFAAAIAVFGVCAFDCLIAGPATAAALPGAARLRRRLDALAWTGLLLAAASGAAWLLAVAANLSGQPLAAALSQGVWRIVLTRTQFGEDWLLRLGFAGLVAGCLLLRRTRSDKAATALPARWAGLVFAGALLAALAWAGHGAATPGTPGDLHLAGDILHLLGAGGWLGTLLPLALLLIEARRAGGAAGAAVAGAATRRFTRLAIASVLLLLAGGIVNTWFLAGSVPALVGTAYGRLLLAKIGLFLATLVIAAVNLQRLSPRLTRPAGEIAWRTAALWLRRNALAEAGFGLAVLAIVGVLGILPPGAHSEPGWPLPFRLDVAALGGGAQALAVALAALGCAAVVALVAAAAAGRYRRAGLFAGALALCLAVTCAMLRPAIEPAYPTSFYAPAEPYAAASVIAGAARYAHDCALCHGRSGEGNGPAAAALAIRPADLTAADVFAHPPGDLFWWVSNGRGNGVMPGFAAVMTPRQRWDVINFIRARAAGAISRGLGAAVAGAAAACFPDFAFDRGAREMTLRQALRHGPVLLALFAAPALPPHVALLLRRQPELAAARLRVIAVDVAAPGPAGNGAVRVAPDILPALALFRSPGDGEETDLLLDRNGDIRARFTAGGEPGLPDAATIIAEARRAAEIPVAAPSHAGHAE